MVGLLLRFPTKTEDVSQLQISAEVIFRSPTELILLSEKLLRIPVRRSRHSVGARRHVVGASGVGFVGVCRKTFITLRVTRRKCIETFLWGCTDLSHDYIKLKRKWGAHFGWVVLFVLASPWQAGDVLPSSLATSVPDSHPPTEEHAEYFLYSE